MIIKKSKKEARESRHARVRAIVKGTTARPRLAVFRSNKHIEVQVIDDEKQITLVSASTFEKGARIEKSSSVEAAKVVGTTIAKRALEKGIENVVFDRGGFLYHGRVKALAEAAREAGLKF
jgi:large subunit ribosomal protein L18